MYRKLGKVYLKNLHPPFKGGPPMPPFHLPFKKVGQPFLKVGWMNILSYPPFLRVDGEKGGSKKGGRGWTSLLKGV